MSVLSEEQEAMVKKSSCPEKGTDRSKGDGCQTGGARAGKQEGAQSRSA